MKDFVSRLSSRKFLLAVASLITLYANKQWHMFAVTAAGYMAAEGAPDIVSRYSQGKVDLAKVSKEAQQLLSDLSRDEDVDKGVITSGVISPTP
jgi:hypothetical protein